MFEKVSHENWIKIIIQIFQNYDYKNQRSKNLTLYKKHKNRVRTKDYLYKYDGNVIIYVVVVVVATENIQSNFYNNRLKILVT